MFQARYRAAYAALGVPLTSGDGVPMNDLMAQPELPLALRDYYAVAGLEERLNQSHNRLLALEDAFVDRGRFVFMEENQNAVVWGVPLNSGAPDPTVEQGVDSGKLEWHSEGVACAEFLETMLYVQASFGALEHVVTADVPGDFEHTLEAKFRRVGRIGTLSAYAPDGCALTFTPWFDDEWRVFGGFHSVKQKRAVAKALGLSWEDL